MYMSLSSPVVKARHLLVLVSGSAFCVVHIGLAGLLSRHWVGLGLVATAIYLEGGFPTAEVDSPLPRIS